MQKSWTDIQMKMKHYFPRNNANCFNFKESKKADWTAVNRTRSSKPGTVRAVEKCRRPSNIRLFVFERIELFCLSMSGKYRFSRGKKDFSPIWWDNILHFLIGRLLSVNTWCKNIALSLKAPIPFDFFSGLSIFGAWNFQTSFPNI